MSADWWSIGKQRSTRKSWTATSRGVSSGAIVVNGRKGTANALDL
jgi:hypothetical protein